MADEIMAIDVMNYLFTPERAKRTIVQEEIQGLFRGGRPPDQWAKGFTPEEFVAQMDEAGFDKVLIPAMKMFSYRSQKLIVDDPVEEVYELTKKFPDRSYNQILSLPR